MKATDFPLHPGNYGIPTREELIEHRIWDSHYHGFMAGGSLSGHAATMFYVERMGIERVIALDIAGGSGARSRGGPAPFLAIENQQKEIHEKESGRVSGIIRIDPTKPEDSCRKIEQWIRNGPCIGIKYSGGAPTGVTCSHPNNDAIVKLCKELSAVIYIHTWIKVGGNPRFPGGGNNGSESTPMDVAILAKRFPDVPMICGHSGGDWELGARAIRSCENVYFEFSGSDPHSGEVDYAVNELGADRIVWGGHGPSRSYATELSKVFDSNLNKADRIKVFGANYRRMAAPIFKQKGYALKM
ncbi:MAG: amidohydrolase family protein [Verrucomicrobia bacterium]|nr:amidohydrolase family protein [Verrucomicrobiota bacterium]